MSTQGTPQFQVTFDSADPHRLAGFWAEALGYEIEDNSELIGQLLAAGQLPAEAVVEVEGRKAFAVGEACVDPTGSRPRLLFQLVGEPKEVKNRVHLDIHVGPENVDDEAARLVALGAEHAWESNDRGVRCVTMRDPQGNEFCLV